VSDYIVMPIHLAARYQRQPGFDPFPHMRPKEVIMCRRAMDHRARNDAALAKWEDREIDNTKN
jgi:hypothetical protein